MSELGNVERLMAVGILVVILGILAIAIRGTSEPETVGVAGGGAPTTVSREPTATLPSTVDAASRRAAGGTVDSNTPRAARGGAAPVASRVSDLGEPPHDAVARAASDATRPTRPGEPPALPVAASRPPLDGPAGGPVALNGLGEAPQGTLGGPPRPDVAAPEPPAPERARDDGRTTYEIQKGDTLWSLCRRWFGDGDVAGQVQLVRELNPELDPDHIVVGQVLVLPRQDAVPTAVVTKPIAQRDGRLYEVRQGDTLSAIASVELGDSMRWKEIYELNRDRLTSPSVLYVGATILLPRD